MEYVTLIISAQLALAALMTNVPLGRIQLQQSQEKLTANQSPNYHYQVSHLCAYQMDPLSVSAACTSDLCQSPRTQIFSLELQATW